MKQEIKAKINEVIKTLYPEMDALEFDVTLPPGGIDADYASNVALIAAKKLKKQPLEVAKAIQDAFGGEEIKVEAVAPGFLNFSLSDEIVLGRLKEVQRHPKDFGAPKTIGQGKLALVEYFQLNVAKPPHVGHLRSAFIGDSLKKLLREAGYKAVSDTHIGDWGTQFGLLLLAYKKNDGKNRVKDNPLEELNQLYVEINKEMERYPELWEDAKKEFVKLEQGDEENRKLWDFFIDISRKKFDEMIKLLKLENFEYDLGESFYEGRMAEIVTRLDKAGLLKVGETGEKYVDLEKFGLGRLICIKSDGATTYELRDLATLAYRYDELAKKEKAEIGWILYVVDVRQSHDFKQVFTVMQILGYDVAKARHIAYGFLTLPEGAISTRKGNVISVEKLLAEARERVAKIIESKNPELKDKERVTEEVALGALKYADLKHNLRSDIVFDWEEVLSFDGNAGPYLQYTHARLQSILRKAGKTGQFGENFPANLTEHDRLLSRQILYFPEILEKTIVEFAPNILANYLYELSDRANSFYHSAPVLKEKDAKLSDFRLALVQSCALTLKRGLGLLGIDAPDEM